MTEMVKTGTGDAGDPAGEPLLEIRGLRVDFPDVGGVRRSTGWT